MERHKHIHLYKTEEEFSPEYAGPPYAEPWLSFVLSGRVKYNKTEYEKSLATPLTLVITSNGELVWRASIEDFHKTIEYKKNDGEWTEITSDVISNAPRISVVSGDTVQFRGNNERYGDHDAEGITAYTTFYGSTCSFKPTKNIMSLVDKETFGAINKIRQSDVFPYLFLRCQVEDAGELLLPPTVLEGQNIYFGLFRECTGLTVPPALPAKVVGSGCYMRMFYGCTSLVNAPELPATKVGSRAYQAMFSNCPNLANIPRTLPAREINQYCYKEMFEACTSLTYSPELPATELWGYCYQRMFSGCTNLETAPVLPALTSTNQCYEKMFARCGKINYIKCMLTSIEGGNALSGWVSGVASTGTFVKNPAMNDWPSGTNGIPTGWTVQDAQ